MSDFKLPNYVAPVTRTVAARATDVSMHARACKERHQALIKQHYRLDKQYKHRILAMFDRHWAYKDSTRFATLADAIAFLDEVHQGLRLKPRAPNRIHPEIVAGNCVVMEMHNWGPRPVPRALMISADYKLLPVPVKKSYGTMDELVEWLGSAYFARYKRGLFISRQPLPIYEYDSAHIMQVVDGDTSSPLYRAHEQFYKGLLAYEAAQGAKQP